MTARQELDPIPYLRAARERLVRLRPLEAVLAGREPGPPVEHAGQHEFRSTFGVGLRDVLERYTRDHPDAGLRFVRYTRAVDGEVDVILDSGDDAPAEDRIVHLTSSVSAADTHRLSIVAEVLIATDAER
jgi:hypothetical protein